MGDHIFAKEMALKPLQYLVHRVKAHAWCTTIAKHYEYDSTNGLMV